MALTPPSWRSASGSTAPASGARESYRETDSDIAAYRGLSNGAQEVAIGMAEVVSGNPTYHSLVLWDRQSTSRALSGNLTPNRPNYHSYFWMLTEFPSRKNEPAVISSTSFHAEYSG